MADPTSATLFLMSAFAAAFAACRLRIRGPGYIQSPDLSGGKLIFLLDDGKLSNANFAGWRLLERLEDSAGASLDRLRSAIAQDFEESALLTAPAAEGGDRVAFSRDGRKQLIRRVAQDSVRLTIDWTRDDPSPAEDLHVVHAMEHELQTLRANTRAAPFLLWRQTQTGEVTWVNQAYLDTVSEVFGNGRVSIWPPPLLFADLARPAGQLEPLRIAIDMPDGRGKAWYDCHRSPVGNDILCTAFRADEAVRSENRRREFTQTLTKTFAELATGLAIFDRSRQLVLFNPALMDLTTLPTDFLAGRPTLFRFLDKLRENHVMPEPRDYRSWRASMAEIEAAASDGTYSDTWSLPDGQTYRITGRPHPDGAVALLFEDISAEMSLTRRFRAELEQAQSVIDVFEDAVAVFSGTGQLSIVNRAYGELWQTDGAETLAGVDVAEATRLWRERALPSPIWGDFRDFVRRNQDRAEWSAKVQLIDGRPLLCRFIPQKGGTTLAMFRLLPADGMPMDDLREAV